MRITPLDVRKQEFRKAVRGLDADEVHAFLATVADEYEFVLTDNKKLRERVIELDEKVGEYRNMEKTLRDTLLTAERVMTEARQNARKEADLILRDAQIKASQEVAGISGRVEALHQQIRELRGHRDSYLARLHSLSEAQIGLIDSYRKDFESTDTRIDRAAEPLDQPSAHETAPDTTRESPAIPAWDPPANEGSDEWRSYDVAPGRRAESPASAPIPPAPPEFTPEAIQPSGVVEPVQLDPGFEPPQPAPSVADPAPHMHTPEPEPWEAPAYQAEQPDYPPEEESRYVQELSSQDYDARVASVADAWSGAVPRVESENLPSGDATAIDEVSAALGMFSEDSEGVPEPASMEGESTSMPPLSDVPPSPWPSNELASDGVPVEPVDRAGEPEGFAGDTNDASTESDEHADGSRWSLTRIARGLTGN